MTTPALTRSDVINLINNSVNLPTVVKPVCYMALMNMSDSAFAGLGDKIAEAIKLIQAEDREGLQAFLTAAGVPSEIIGYVVNQFKVK